ncbi:MAG: hypothetical protein ABL904_09585 [Hyphomicrobiaceae bacterium]
MNGRRDFFRDALVLLGSFVGLTQMSSMSVAGEDKKPLIEDANGAALWVAGKLHDSGYKADFSLASIPHVERFLDENADLGKAKPRGLLAGDHGPRLFALAGYLGETWRRAGSGTWDAPVTDAPPHLQDFELAILFPNGVRGWPGRAIVVRFFNGKEAGDLTVVTRALASQGAFKWEQ